MFTVSVEMTFNATHQLELPDGSKEPTHTHNWTVTVEVAGRKLDKMGVVMDFHKLRAQMRDIIEPLDNSKLDAVHYFRENSQSAENVAKYIYEKINAKLPQDLDIRAVKVGEEQGCWAKYDNRENDFELI